MMGCVILEGLYKAVGETPAEKIKRLADELEAYKKDSAAIEEELKAAREEVEATKKAAEKKTRGQVVADDTEMVWRCSEYYGPRHTGFGPPEHRVFFDLSPESSLESLKSVLAGVIDAEIAKAKADERERCAKVCENAAKGYHNLPSRHVYTGDDVADRLRWRAVEIRDGAFNPK